MPKYLFGSHVYSTEHESWPRILQKGYAAKLRPVCLCLVQSDGPSLYIAQARGQYLLKRMPYSGPMHAPHCDHYEPPPELSGLGQVSGSAIREELETQTTVLSLDFALNKGRSRQPAAASEIEHESVRSDGTKLTMRGLLHFLMDDAGLTRWAPGMAGKRSWYVVRRELLRAASSKMTKGQPLPALLHIPETFALDRADEIRERGRESLARLSDSSSARMILLAEVKAIEDARYGKCLIVKHMPDARLMMTDELHKHMVSRFAHQLQLWGQLEASHLMMLATISRSVQGVVSVEAACLMNVNEHWIPFESLFEWELLDTLHRSQRRFTKGLRYNLPAKKPLACAVLQDTGQVSTALYIVPQEAEAEHETALDELVERSDLQSWKWHAGLHSMPELPRAWVANQNRAQEPEAQDQPPDELPEHEPGFESEPGEPFEQRES